jgi:hypothetical protein
MRGWLCFLLSQFRERKFPFHRASVRVSLKEGFYLQNIGQDLVKRRFLFIQSDS